MKKTDSINTKNKLLWSLVFLLIAALSIYAVMTQSKSFSVEDFRSFITSSNPYYLICAVLCMLGFVFFEGLALVTICRAFRFKCSHLNGFLYSATDIYFSAITPSATGGQPVCGYFMIKDGLPTSFTTVALIANLCAYALSTLLLGLLSLIARPSLLFNFGIVSRILIYIGYFIQIALIAVFVLVLKRKEIIISFCNWCYRVLGKIKLCRKPHEKIENLNKKMQNYSRYAFVIQGRKSMLLKVIVFNLLQKASQIAVTMFTYLATGGKITKAFDIFCLQSYTVTGANCVPVPGAMGVTDYLMLDCFGSIMSEADAANLELFSRSLSFYSCVVVCGIAVLIKIIMQKKKK